MLGSEDTSAAGSVASGFWDRSSCTGQGRNTKRHSEINRRSDSQQVEHISVHDEMMLTFCRPDSFSTDGGTVVNSLSLSSSVRSVLCSFITKPGTSPASCCELQ